MAIPASSHPADRYRLYARATRARSVRPAVLAGGSGRRFWPAVLAVGWRFWLRRGGPVWSSDGCRGSLAGVSGQGRIELFNGGSYRPAKAEATGLQSGGSYRPAMAEVTGLIAADHPLRLLCHHLPRRHHPYRGIRCECPIHAAGTTWLGHSRLMKAGAAAAGPDRQPPQPQRSLPNRSEALLY